MLKLFSFACPFLSILIARRMQMVLMLSSLLLIAVVVGEVTDSVCPQTDIFPCRCSDFIKGGTQLECHPQHASNKVNDTKISEILDTMLSLEQPGGSDGLRDLQISSLLTHIPSQLSQFTTLGRVNLMFNEITTIESNAFNFSNTAVVFLRLDANPITTIQPGAFQGTMYTIRIFILTINNLCYTYCI